MKNVLFGDSLCQALCNNSHIRQVCYDLLQTHLSCDSSKYPIFQVHITRLDAKNKHSIAIWCLTSADATHGTFMYNKYAMPRGFSFFSFFLSCHTFNLVFFLLTKCENCDTLYIEIAIQNDDRCRSVRRRSNTKNVFSRFV